MANGLGRQLSPWPCFVDRKVCWGGGGGGRHTEVGVKQVDQGCHQINIGAHAPQTDPTPEIEISLGHKKASV